MFSSFVNVRILNFLVRVQIVQKPSGNIMGSDYSSGFICRSEPAIIEFPELKGHTRRDYWLAIMREILLVHKFIRKFQISGVARDEALSKAVLGILRLQAIQELSSTDIRHEDILLFNLCEELPGGDLILKTLATMSSVKEAESTNHYKNGGGMYSASSMAMVTGLGFVFGTKSSDPNVTALAVGEVAVGEMSSLERAVRESKDSYKKVVVAQATVDGVKVDGLDTNLAVMKVRPLLLSGIGTMFSLVLRSRNAYLFMLDHDQSRVCVHKYLTAFPSCKLIFCPET